MSGEDTNREFGIEFGSLTEELENEQFPLKKDELVERYGDRTIDIADGKQQLSTILGPLGPTTYDSVDEIRQSILGMVGSDAVGREGYSDRAGISSEAKGDEESF